MQPTANPGRPRADDTPVTNVDGTKSADDGAEDWPNEGLPTDECVETAQRVRSIGNEYFKAGELSKAVAKYSKALRYAGLPASEE